MKPIEKPARRPAVYFTPAPEYEQQLNGLEALCRRTRSDLARTWAQEKLDTLEFPCLEFRGAGPGVVAVVRGTRLAVWQIALAARKLGWGEKLARHFDIIPEAAASAAGYCERHPEEIATLIAANDLPLATLRQRFPKLRASNETAD